MTETALDRFLRYAQIDTQSQEGIGVTPSTKKQFDLANMLVKELKDMGVPNVEIDDHCYVYASIPSNLPETHPAYGKVPAIGFLAHVDTSPDSPGNGVKPQVITNYQGGDIPLQRADGMVIKVSENEPLKNLIGDTIVTSDGTTLLGADDKAGVAAIMTAAEFFINNKDVLHGDIRIAFTPDEEIGQGTIKFNLQKFGAKYAYTIDGELPGELNKETFSANGATVIAEGRDIHPGNAKEIMVNSIRAIADVIARMPRDMAPETTELYEPYIHPHSVNGSVTKSTLKILFRDFETPGLDKQKEIMEGIIKEVQELNPKTKIRLEIVEMYRNMRDELDKHPLVLETLWEAAEKAGANPYWKPIRGGTDGSRLTEMGLPTPNIYGGGQNFHSKNEWLSVKGMNTAVETIKHLLQIWVERTK